MSAPLVHPRGPINGSPLRDRCVGEGHSTDARLAPPGRRAERHPEGMTNPVAVHPLAPMLAFIPTVLGGRPSDRVVVVALAEGHTFEMFSHTLPWRGEHRTTRRVARQLALAAAEKGDTESILIAVFCRAEVGGASGRPYDQLQRVLGEAAHYYNMHVAESFYVAADGLGVILLR